MFEPHNKFAGCKSLEKTLIGCKTAGTISDEIYSDFEKYHYTIVHKLKCAQMSLNNLYVTLNSLDHTQAISNAQDLNTKVNMQIDSFFYFCNGSLDVLAREVLVLFGQPLVNKIYFQTARFMLKRIIPSDPFLAYLDDPLWMSEFKDYRNTSTHEVLICTNFNINVSIVGQQQQCSIVYPLPDDPRVYANQRTYRKNANAFNYCDLCFRRVLSTINIVLSQLNNRIITQGGLPLH